MKMETTHPSQVRYKDIETKNKIEVAKRKRTLCNVNFTFLRAVRMGLPSQSRRVHRSRMLRACPSILKMTLPFSSEIVKPSPLALSAFCDTVNSTGESDLKSSDTT